MQYLLVVFDAGCFFRVVGLIRIVSGLKRLFLLCSPSGHLNTCNITNIFPQKRKMKNLTAPCVWFFAEVSSTDGHRGQRCETTRVHVVLMSFTKSIRLWDENLIKEQLFVFRCLSADRSSIHSNQIKQMCIYTNAAFKSYWKEENVDIWALTLTSVY